MPTTDAETRSAYEDITNGCDGPVTPLVLIGRAIELASTHSYSNAALTDALFSSLADWDVDFQDAATTYHES